jgi:hypothetical protein
MSEGSQVSVYATNYNVLRIMSGMGGFAYAPCRTFYRLAITLLLPLFYGEVSRTTVLSE